MWVHTLQSNLCITDSQEALYRNDGWSNRSLSFFGQFESFLLFALAKHEMLIPAAMETEKMNEIQGNEYVNYKS